MNDTPGGKRPHHHVAHDDSTASCRELTGERKLLLALMKRALADAQGIRLGSDGPPVNTHIKREARKWFRDGEKTALGWSWIVETLGLPRDFVVRIERAAKTECAANNIEIAWRSLFDVEPDGGAHTSITFESI